MRRILLTTFLIFILLSLSGCREKTKEEEFNDIQKTFNSISNYTSTAHIKVTGNKSPESFKAEHIFEKPDRYISQIIEPKGNSGNKTIYNGNSAYLYNKKVNQYTTLKDVKITDDKVLFLGYFLRNLSNVEELEITKEIKDKVEYIVIAIDIPGNNMYRAYEKLWIDKTTHLPHKLIIYDNKNKEVVNVKYSNVKYNTDIEKEIFNIN